MKVQGCVAMVTGAASGIGKAVCQALAAKGAKVCMVDVNAIDGKSAAEELKLAHGMENILFVQADVSLQGQLEAAFNKGKSTFGHLDVVVNNAGILNEINWRSCVDVNLVGVISGTMLAVNHMSKENGGSGGVIINMSSRAGLWPGQHPPVPTYAATKAAVIAHTLAWSANLRCKQEGIRFNAICPEGVDTPTLRKFNPEFAIDLTEQDMELFRSSGRMKPSCVAEVVIGLIEDDTKQGAIVYLSTEGAKMVEYPVHAVTSTAQ